MIIRMEYDLLWELYGFLNFSVANSTSTRLGSGSKQAHDAIVTKDILPGD